MERDRKVTELVFAVSTFHLFQMVCEEPIDSYSRKIKSSGLQNGHWNIFLFQLADFFKSLQMVKYRFINIQSFKKKFPSWYEVFQPWYQRGLRLLDDAGVK